MPVPAKWSDYLRQHELENNEIAQALAENLVDPDRADIGWFSEAILALEQDRKAEGGLWIGYENTGKLAYKKVRKAIKANRKKLRPKKPPQPEKVYDPNPTKPITGNLSVTVKIYRLPKPTPLTDKSMYFRISSQGTKINVSLKPKAWKKLGKAKAFKYWVASIQGKMGKSTENGFVLDEPGVQVFECNPPKNPQSGESILINNIRFSEVPEAREIPNNKMEFRVSCQNLTFVVQVKKKAWRKIAEANENYPSWLGIIEGISGQVLPHGLELERPSVKIFEKRQKKQQ